MRKKYKEDKEIYLRLGDQAFPLDPFVYKNGYELQARKISKEAGIKIELLSGSESHAVILPPTECRELVSYMQQALKCEKNQKH